MLDLDETVFDNSSSSGNWRKTGKGLSLQMDDWINKAEAEALPGAIDFFNIQSLKV